MEQMTRVAGLDWPKVTKTFRRYSGLCFLSGETARPVWKRMFLCSDANLHFGINRHLPSAPPR
jgi:hypothetical protein